MSAARTTPAWLLEPEFGVCPCCSIGRRRRGSAVDKTIRGLTGVLRRALQSEELAARPGLLQRLDARVKLVATLALLVASGLVRHVPVLVALYVLTLALAAASRLPVGWFVKRVWLFVPIFTGVIVLPATFSFVTPGEVVLPLGQWFGHPVGITRQGLVGAGLIVCRVAVSISFVVLLTLTTSWSRLLAGLGTLKVPRLLVLVIGMAYRYLFVLLDGVADMYTARKARTISTANGRAGRMFVASSAGALFGKAHALSEEIYQAMLARGYRGEPRTLDRARLTLADAGVLVVCLVLVVAVVGGDRALGL